VWICGSDQDQVHLTNSRRLTGSGPKPERQLRGALLGDLCSTVYLKRGLESIEVQFDAWIMAFFFFLSSDGLAWGHPDGIYHKIRWHTGLLTEVMMSLDSEFEDLAGAGRSLVKGTLDSEVLVIGGSLLSRCRFLQRCSY